MELLHLMIKKLQKHSINIFVRFLKTYQYQKLLPLRKRYYKPAKFAFEKYKDHPSITSIKIK